MKTDIEGINLDKVIEVGEGSVISSNKFIETMTLLETNPAQINSVILAELVDKREITQQEYFNLSQKLFKVYEGKLVG